MINKKEFLKYNEYTEENLFALALYHLHSVGLLFTDLFGFFSGGFLLHLSVELVFKACCLFYLGKFPGTHSIKKLLHLVKSNIELDEADKKFIKTLDRLHNLRYKANEIGTDDLDRAKRLLHNMVNQMPEKLKNIYENEREKIIKNYSRTPERVFKDLSRNHAANIYSKSIKSDEPLP